jgi:hypothetical protein
VSFNDALRTALGAEEETPVVDVPKEEEHRIKGKIIKVSDEGWGFISSKDIKFTRIFFHWTSLKQGTLNFTGLKNWYESRIHTS